MAHLPDVVAALEAIAPPRLAAPWDNVGLLLEGTRDVSRVVVCVDLTPAVLAEALGLGADLILAYHPPLFAPVKRLTTATPYSRLLLALVRSGLHVYSPHTALDAAGGGMTDWLLEPFGPLASVSPIEPDRADPTVGAGRVATLRAPAEWGALADAVKAHLGVDHVRVAVPTEPRPIRRVAVCPGAGGTVFDKVDADLYVTGELRHHDVLARVAAGAVVVLSEHTHTERGFLPRVARQLEAAVPGLVVSCATSCADPLVTR